jgi:glycogen synthase
VPATRKRKMDLQELKEKFPADCNVYIGYNEELAHLFYAGSDFLLMPSRIEPCGLNQLYSLRYGTMPMVRSTGGLKDTVIDFGDKGGYGIRYLNTSVKDICYAVSRAIVLFDDNKTLQTLRKRMMALDFSWDVSAKQYMELYQKLKYHNNMTSKVICIVLGGGQGSRLYPLTATRSKPAVPIAGKYRLVDIPISNCLHSGITRIYVLTQFKLGVVK